MIRFANKFDVDSVIDLMKKFAIESKNPTTNDPLKWSKTYIEAILATILAGSGFILIDNKKTAILIAVKTQSFWLKDVYQLQEVMLYSNNKVTTVKLIKEYARIARGMIQDGVISQAVMASYKDTNYNKLGMTKIQNHWEVKNV